MSIAKPERVCQMTTEKIILVQCGKCGYWHDNDTEENQGWVPYCDLHHGDGLAYPCSEFKPINSQQLRNTDVKE